MVKHSKAQAEYGAGMLKAHCGICRHFQAPSSCGVVAGVVKRTGWCKYFIAKPKPAK